MEPDIPHVGGYSRCRAKLHKGFQNVSTDGRTNGRTDKPYLVGPF